MVSLLKPLKRPAALSDQVYETLRQHLRDGKIPPEQPLQEVNLAVSLGVSRTPVREALARLASEGLVTADGRSFVVPTVTDADIEDIYEVRCLLEPEALRQAAVRGAEPKARELVAAAVQASIEAHRAGNAQAFMTANAQFRNAWIALVRNRRLVRAMELYADHVRYVRLITLGDPKVRTVVIKGLKRIAAALTAGDGEAAARAMHEHLGEAKRFLRLAVGLNNNGNRE